MRTLTLLAAALLAAGCAGDGASEQAATEAAWPPPTAPGSPDARLSFGSVETVVRDLEVPWGVAFVDEDTMLVTERAGRVLVVEGGEVRAEPAAEIGVEAVGEGGLLGIALHPDFPRERYAYLYYTHASGNRISRFAVTDDLRLEDEELLVGGIPANAFHNGGRVAFGPDGMLYATTGDAQEPFLAADPTSLAGKILRLTPEGEVPPGNPFGDSPQWSYGHRNPQGLAWDDDGTLYASEHGPTGELGLCCHDEVNRIEAGGFYGWPFVAGRVEAAEGSPPEEPIPPVFASGDDTWAPAGLASARGELYMALLAGRRLLRLDPGADRVETALDGYGRLRVAAVGPDGCLYVATSNRDGRGEPAPDDDRILRVC